MQFPESFLRELAERNDIESVVSDYVALTKRSGQNVFGLCPFHSEKTPSFAVNPSKQFYHCFGCGKGGDVINFIMDMENMSFPEAVEFLAKRVNMPLPEKGGDGRSAIKRKRAIEANTEAARFFHSELMATGGKEAMNYLSERGMRLPTIRNFGLGYAPDAWDLLLRHMREKGYSDFELYDSGLVKRSESGGCYDTFRGRIVFPIIDVRGNVLGFSGRTVVDDRAKYLNSPETIIFNKGRHLFGMNLAKKSKLRYFVLVEGNMDVCSLHQAGIDSAVASLGTALSDEQARLISRYKKELIIAYDMDSAGRAAAERAMGLLQKLELEVRILELGDAKDPDEYIKKYGRDAMLNLIDASDTQQDFRLKKIEEKYDMKSETSRLKFLDEAGNFIASLSSPLEREIYLQRVAERAGVRPEALAVEVKRIIRRKARTRAREDERKNRPTERIQPKSRELRYENSRSAAAEEGLIRLLYLYPFLYEKCVDLSPEKFSSPCLRKIYELITDEIRREQTPNLSVLGQHLEPDESALLVSILKKPESAEGREKALSDYMQTIISENAARDLSGEGLRNMAELFKNKKGYEADVKK